MGSRSILTVVSRRVGGLSGEWPRTEDHRCDDAGDPVCQLEPTCYVSWHGARQTGRELDSDAGINGHRSVRRAHQRLDYGSPQHKSTTGHEAGGPVTACAPSPRRRLGRFFLIRLPDDLRVRIRRLHPAQGRGYRRWIMLALLSGMRPRYEVETRLLGAEAAGQQTVDCDARVTATLTGAGWIVRRSWEHARC